jgi:16S rRNA (adenine1518-N6/adenine1519-N6)-dimethyltransferase
MSQTKQQIQAMLSEASTSPRHRFGQNFMIDRNLVSLVADAGEIQAGDLVIEVGPGTGTLTEELLARTPQVIAVEIDRDLAALLRRHFADRPGFRLIEGDALESKHQLNREMTAAIREATAAGQRVRLVANLPYNIASPLVIELLLEGVSHLAFTVQKEVAQRLKAVAGSDDYGPLTAVAQLLAQVTIERNLPPQAFWPAPKIESALVMLRRLPEVPADARQLGVFVAALFASRRKMLRKALQQAGVSGGEAAIARLGLTGQERPEVLTPQQLLALFRYSAAP